MKTIVLMGISCLMLAGVYGVMNKESVASKILSFNQAQGATSPIDSGDKDKTNNASSTEHTTATSKTLDDSHWIEGPLVEKAAGSELITDNEVDLSQAQSNPETIKQAAPRNETIREPKAEVKQLILDLGADSMVEQKVPVESI